MSQYSEGARILDDSAEHVDLVQQLAEMRQANAQAMQERQARLRAVAASGKLVVLPGELDVITPVEQ